MTVRVAVPQPARATHAAAIKMSLCRTGRCPFLRAGIRSWQKTPQVAELPGTVCISDELGGIRFWFADEVVAQWAPGRIETGDDHHLAGGADSARPVQPASLRGLPGVHACGQVHRAALSTHQGRSRTIRRDRLGGPEAGAGHGPDNARAVGAAADRCVRFATKLR